MQLYPSLISHLQTDAYIHNFSPTHPFYQITPLYSHPIQSYAHPCEFHQLPSSWPKMHHSMLLLYQLQAHSLTYMTIKHFQKYFFLLGNICNGKLPS